MLRSLQSSRLQSAALPKVFCLTNRSKIARKSSMAPPILSLALPSETGRVLSIQSHTVQGYVGNKSAVFPLQLLGYDVDPINSVQFSNHTGYPTFKGQVLNGQQLWDIIEGLEANSLLYYTHLLTGYIGSVSFLNTVLQVVEKLRSVNPQLIYVCDPVMGDEGKLYVPPELVDVYRQKVVPVASMLTPNQFEAELLTGFRINSESDGLEACNVLHAAGPSKVVLTSAHIDDHLLLIGSHKKDHDKPPEQFKIMIPKIPAYFTGTGDLMTALLLGWSNKYPDNLDRASELAVSSLQAVLGRTVADYNVTGYDTQSSSLEIRLIQSQDDIRNPQVGRHCTRFRVFKGWITSPKTTKLVPATRLPPLGIPKEIVFEDMEVKLKMAFVILFIAFTEARLQPAPAPVTADILHQVASSLQMFVDELPQMPKLYGFTLQRGLPVPAHLTIGMFQKQWKFHRDLPATTVFAYGTSQRAATVPGPTIETRQGIATYIEWQNYLPQAHILPWDPTVPTAIPKTGGVPTVVHLHGGVHEPQSDGNALAWFTAGLRQTGPAWSKSTYTYLNVQHPGNLWYHDHALGLTRVNLLAGLIGAYVVRNPEKEAELDLPSGDQFDQHLVIFDRSFLSDGSLYINRTGDVPAIHPQWQPEYFGDAIIVNGKAWPFMKVQRRKYRFRIINAGNARYYQLSLSNGLQFTVIGSDSSYLARPVVTGTLLLSPSEIADVIIDFSGSQSNEAVLSNAAPYPYPGGNPVDSLNSKVMKFIILPGVPMPSDKSNVPANLFKYQSEPNTNGITVQRYIVLYDYTTPDGRSTHLYINGLRFEDPVTETPKSGGTEIWEVINLTADNHPLHVHLGTLQAIQVQELVDLANFTSCMTVQNDAIKCNVKAHATGKLISIPDYEKTWKNSVKMAPGYVTTVVVNFHLVETKAPYPFDATAEPGYVYHCHILDHEDNAMIRPLKLVR